MDFLAPHLRTSRHSQTLSIHEQSQERSARGETVHGFGFGQSPFPVPREICVALASAAHRKEYTSVQGLLPLREAIAGLHNALEGKAWSAEQIFVGTGSKILIYCLMAAFRRAEVLLPAPSWVSYAPQAELAGHRYRWIETTFEDGWRLSPERLDRLCRSRSDSAVPLILVLNYPSNPTGQTYSADELSALADIMRQHRMVVIADEIYGLLNFAGDYPTLESFYPEGTIVTSGLSKWCGAGGWRLGFARIAPEFGSEFSKVVLGVASETYSCAAAPIQVGATLAYQDVASAREFLQRQTRILSAVGTYCSEALRAVGIKVHPAQGGFYLFPDFEKFRAALCARNIHGSEGLTEALMADTGVALLPGSAFGMADDSLTARLAFVDFPGDEALGADLDAPAFDHLKRGIEATVGWLARMR